MVTDRVEIRCPFKKISKFDGKLYQCPQICVKVDPGSSGEAWCRRCKLAFEFEVDSQSNYRPKVKVKHEDT